MLPSNSCSKLWGIKQQCLPTRHYCMFEDATSVFKIDDKHVCGVSFCSACAVNASLEGRNLCPYHNPKSSLYGINSCISFVDNDNEVKALHLKDGILRTREKNVSCKMKTSSECCYIKKTEINLGRTKGFVVCNNSNHAVPLHSECFRQLIQSKCNGFCLFAEDNTSIDSIHISCGKHCYNLMKKDKQ